MTALTGTWLMLHQLDILAQEKYLTDADSELLNPRRWISATTIDALVHDLMKRLASDIGINNNEEDDVYDLESCIVADDQPEQARLSMTETCPPPAFDDLDFQYGEPVSPVDPPLFDDGSELTLTREGSPTTAIEAKQPADVAVTPDRADTNVEEIDRPWTRRSASSRVREDAAVTLSTHLKAAGKGKTSKRYPYRTTSAPSPFGAYTLGYDPAVTAFDDPEHIRSLPITDPPSLPTPDRAGNKTKSNKWLLHLNTYMFYVVSNHIYRRASFCSKHLRRSANALFCCVRYCRKSPINI